MKQKIPVFIGAFFFLLSVTAAGTLLTGCSRKEPDFFISGENSVEASGSETETDKTETGATETDKTEVDEKETNQTEVDKTEITSAAEETDSASVESLTETENMIYVDVCGAVVNPDVYQLSQDSRVFQAIEAAGGMKEDAARGYLNLAQILTDGQQIYIPTKAEAESLNFSGGAADRTAAENAGIRGNESGNSSTKVNLNTADAQALMTLSGIGESKALAIIAYREEQGGFTSVDELMNVPGIKEGTFSKIKENIAIE